MRGSKYEFVVIYGRGLALVSASCFLSNKAQEHVFSTINHIMK